MGDRWVSDGVFSLQLRDQIADGFFQLLFQVRVTIVFFAEPIGEHKRANLVFQLS